LSFSKNFKSIDSVHLGKNEEMSINKKINDQKRLEQSKLIYNEPGEKIFGSTYSVKQFETSSYEKKY
jgi:hypothetical protein